MLWETNRYFLNGWIENLYIRQEFHFKYQWFQWIEDLPGPWMYGVFLVLGTTSVLIILGWYYRVATLIFCFTYTYLFLIDQAYYNNHFYLIIIFSFMMIFTPLHHSWSLDVRSGRVHQQNTLPAFWLWWMRFPMTLVYVYGAIAKMEPDWLSGKATRGLLGRANQGTFLEPLMQYDWMPLFYAWSGMLFDLCIPFAMLIKKIRIPAFIAALFFHINNYVVFPIGVFPPLSIALTLMYFDPDFPKKLAPQSIRQRLRELSSVQSGKKTQIPKVSLPQPVLQICFFLFVIIHLVLPFRHWFYPGNTSWHQEGHYFAWRMMLRQKEIQLKFDVKNPETGEIRYADPKDYLNPTQYRNFAGNPQMLLLFVHHLGELVQKHGGFKPEIYGTIWVGLNGREPKLLTDPELNLFSVPKYTSAYLWTYQFD